MYVFSSSNRNCLHLSGSYHIGKMLLPDLFVYICLGITGFAICSRCVCSENCQKSGMESFAKMSLEYALGSPLMSRSYYR